jgi:hypothetical protein
MDRKHLYQIYTKHERYAYFVSQVEPKLQRYARNRIPDGSLPSEVLAAVQRLVEEVQQLPLERKDYTDTQKNQSGSITALIGYTLFRKRRVRLDRTLEILQRYFQGTDLDDVCQFSLVVISNSAKFLRNFQAEPDWYESLCRYSHNKFPKSLTDELRRLAGDKFQRTNLGVLYRTSPGKVATIVGEQFKQGGGYYNRLVLLHQCFQEAVTAKEFITNDPQPVNYDALLARYRTVRAEQDLEIVDRKEVTELLADLSDSARNYYQPTGGARSLDEVVYAGEESTSDTVGDKQEAPVSMSQEDSEKRELALELLRQNSPSCVEESLKSGIATKLDRKLEKIRLADLTFFLLDGLGLTQIEAEGELKRNFTVLGKRRSKAILTLAREFYFRYENQTPTKDISAEILDRYKNYIEPIFEDYYAEMAIDLLAEVTGDTMQSSIVEAFIQRIETQWQFRFKPEGGGLSKVYTFVQQQQNRGKWDDDDKIHKSLRLNKTE